MTKSNLEFVPSKDTGQPPRLIKVLGVHLVGGLGGPPRGFGQQGNKGIYFKGSWEQRPNFGGNRGTKTLLENRVH